MSDAEFDWLSSTVEARRLLYRHIKRVIDTSALTWTKVYREGLGEAGAPGLGYEDNFRSGRIARGKAARLYGWLRVFHPATADRLDLDLEEIANVPNGEWEKLLAAYGRFAELDVISLAQGEPGIVGFADAEPLSRVRVRLGEPFCFRLNTDREGRALAFQSVGGRWYSLPLSRDRLSQAVEKGSVYLPLSPDGTSLAPLVEDHDAGRHRFVIALATKELVSALEDMVGDASELTGDRLSMMAGRLKSAGSGCTIHRLNVLFVR